MGCQYCLRARGGRCNRPDCFWLNWAPIEEFRSHTLRTIAAKRALDPRPALESLNEPDLPLSIAGDFG